MASGADWLGIGALAVTTVTAIVSVLKKSPLSTASRVEELRSEIADLREQHAGLREQHQDCIALSERLERRITSLELQLDGVRGESLYWQGQWRQLRAELDKKSA